MAGNNFDDKSVERIVRAVRVTERLPASLGGPPSGSRRQARGPEGYSPYPVVVVLSGNLAAGSSASGTIYAWNGSTWATTSQTITVRDVRLSGSDIPSGGRCVCVSMHNAWWVIFGEVSAPTLVVLTGTLAAAGSATADIYSWNASAWSTTGVSITVRDYRTSGSSIASGKRCVVVSMHGAWWVISTQC